MKREELYRTKYRSERELKKAIDDYILFYNEKSPHARNSYKTQPKLKSSIMTNKSQIPIFEGFKILFFTICALFLRFLLNLHSDSILKIISKML